MSWRWHEFYALQKSPKIGYFQVRARDKEEAARIADTLINRQRKVFGHNPIPIDYIGEVEAPMPSIC